MPRSPLKDFLCVAALLVVMACAVAFGTRPAAQQAPPPRPAGTAPPAGNVRCGLRLLFSHRPVSVKINGTDTRPDGNELDMELTLPAGKLLELPIDIRWRELPGARYFTQITVRRDGREDQVTVFADQYAEFADVFTVDTRTP